ncbi:TPA: hypothetical protein KHV65_003594 [Escherichia coli]|nr:hypothetical protein [Escherichia coli]
MAVILVVKRDHFPGVKDDMEADKRFASDCLFWGLKYGDRKIIPESICSVFRTKIPMLAVKN